VTAGTAAVKAIDPRAASNGCRRTRSASHSVWPGVEVPPACNSRRFRCLSDVVPVAAPQFTDLARGVVSVAAALMAARRGKMANP